jgi:chromosome segregation ATPase
MRSSSKTSTISNAYKHDGRNGWHDQATSLVSSHSALGTTAKTLVDRSGPLLRRRPLLEVQDQEFDSASEEIGIELARKLDAARTEIARLELRLSHDAAAAQDLRAQIKASAAAAEAADQRAAGLAREIAAARGGLQENIDLLTAENARLLQGHAERGMALDDAQDKIKFLKTRSQRRKPRRSASRPRPWRTGPVRRAWSFKNNLI